MNTLTFSLKIFRVATKDSNNEIVWDLLTVDGETPNNTIYFMRKGDAPSSQHSDQIVAAIENEEWVVVYEDANPADFDIDLSVFETSGEAYANIALALQKELAH